MEERAQVCMTPFVAVDDDVDDVEEESRARSQPRPDDKPYVTEFSTSPLKCAANHDCFARRVSPVRYLYSKFPSQRRSRRT